MQKTLKKLKILFSATLLLSGVGMSVLPIAVHAAEELTQQEIKALNDLYKSLQDGYIEAPDKRTLLEGAMKGMVNAVGDPYSEYFNKSESQNFESQLSDSFEGIGVQFQSKSGQVVIVSPIDGTPAAKAGLQPNDIILSADGTELKDKTTQEVVGLIRGKKGTEVTLSIQRGETVFEQKVVRDTIPVYSVVSTIDKDDPTIAHIKITQFIENTGNELMDAVKKARESGVKRFVFDLRNDPGGLLTQALAIGNMFVKDGDVIMQVQSRDSDPEVYKASNQLYGDFKITEPYVLMIDNGSASASEIVAAAIKENTSRPLVGEKSFGKGTVQQLMNQSDVGELKLTIAKWLTPKGEWIHEKGIEPSVVVEAAPISKVVLLDPATTLEQGQASEPVKNLAIVLEALGYTVSSKEYFDDAMTTAVKQFQKDNGLTEDGKVTDKTANALNDAAREYVKTHDVQYDKAKEALLKEAE